jgi:Pentapeptide repeats (8 copies)
MLLQPISRKPISAGANLSGAKLSLADLRDANLLAANLRRADLTKADLRSADLRSANLSRANLTEANLTEANLANVELTDASLAASVLIKANLTKAILSGVCIDNANISDWVIEDVVCTYITQVKSGESIRIAFEPREFEKKYTQIVKIAELILSVPLTESTGFIANAIAQSINRIKKSPVISWKGVEALSDGDTKMTFNVFDGDFYQHQKEIIGIGGSL